MSEQPEANRQTDGRDNVIEFQSKEVVFQPLRFQKAFRKRQKVKWNKIQNISRDRLKYYINIQIFCRTS